MDARTTLAILVVVVVSLACGEADYMEGPSNHSLSNIEFVATYYGADNYHRWLHTQYPLLNISDTTSFEYRFLTIATLERNLSDINMEMLHNHVEGLCHDLNPHCEYHPQLLLFVSSLYAIFTIHQQDIHTPPELPMMSLFADPIIHWFYQFTS